jgi:tetratricopeptide (TPR) repeat protein
LIYRLISHYQMTSQPSLLSARLASTWLAAFCLGLSAFAVCAETSDKNLIRSLSDEWAEIFYLAPDNSTKAEKFHALLPRIRALKAENPKRAEPLIMEGITLCTLASVDLGISTLARLAEARELLVKSIDLDPRAMDAAAFITLGNLYFRLPGWPISYGDKTQARIYLEAAVRLYPDAIDSNYFLGDYWLSENAFDQALVYLEKARSAPIRPHQRLSDTRIKSEIEAALQAARKRSNNRGDFFSKLLPPDLD